MPIIIFELSKIRVIELSVSKVGLPNNIELLLKAKDTSTSWDAVKNDYQDLNTFFFEKTPWLKASTVSEAADKVKAYFRLKMSVTKSQSEIHVYCDNFMTNQAFYMRSDKTVKEVIGGSFSKISDNYYLINATTPNFSVILD